MRITREIFEQGKSLNGGYNKKQLTALGEGNQDKGWFQRILTNDYTKEQIDLFLSLKDYHFKNKEDKQRFANKQYIRLKKPILHPCNEFIEYKNQYLHPNWQRVRLFVLERDKFSCQECGVKDKTLHVHHLKYLKNNYIWSVPTWYLITLCDQCHSNEHGRDLAVKH